MTPPCTLRQWRLDSTLLCNVLCSSSSSSPTGRLLWPYVCPRARQIAGPPRRLFRPRNPTSVRITLNQSRLQPPFVGVSTGFLGSRFALRLGRGARARIGSASLRAFPGSFQHPRIRLQTQTAAERVRRNALASLRGNAHILGLLSCSVIYSCMF